MKEIDGIVIKDGQIILNSREELSIDQMIEGARNIIFFNNRHFKDTKIKGIADLRVVFENCIFENVFLKTVI